MHAQILDVLFHGLLNGGNKLNRKKLGFTSDKADPQEKQLLATMNEQGLLRKDGRSHCVTDKGEELFRQHGSTELLRKLEDHPLGEFLRVVQSRQGKALTKKQREGLCVQTRERALSDGLIEVTGKDQYRLTAAGDVWLTVRLPLDQSLQRVASSLKQLSLAMDALEGEITRQCQDLQGIEAECVIDTDFSTQRQELDATLQSQWQSLQQQACTPYLVKMLASRYQELRLDIDNRLRTMEQSTHTALAEREREMATLREKQVAARDTLHQQLEQLQERQPQILDLLKKLQQVHAGDRRHDIAGTPDAFESKPEETSSVHPISEAELVAAMKKHYCDIVAAQPLSRVVAFPDLFRRLKQNFPRLDVLQFKDTLSRLCDNAVVDLYPIDDGSELREPEFGIPTSLGDLYYVLWR